MLIQCSWCKDYLGEKKPYKNKDISHTICPSCEAKENGVIAREALVDVIRNSDTSTRLGFEVANTVWGMIKEGRV